MEEFGSARPSHSSHGTALLLPRINQCIIGERRSITIGSSELAGWYVECRVRDKARWKNEWSGIVALRRIRA
jgi:hypothetical protein